MKKIVKKKVVSLIIIIIGIIICAYPIISKIIASYNQTVAIKNYKNIVQKEDKEKIQKMKEEAKEYNDKIVEEDGFLSSFNNNKEDAISYFNVLNIGEIIGYINIPKINAYLPIYHGVSDDVLKVGIGHIGSTSFPVGGKGTHSILMGHNGQSRIKEFDNLDKLEIGDNFYINVLDEVLTYKVDNIEVKKPEEIR